MASFYHPLQLRKHHPLTSLLHYSERILNIFLVEDLNKKIDVSSLSPCHSPPYSCNFVSPIRSSRKQRPHLNYYSEGSLTKDNSSASSRIT